MFYCSVTVKIIINSKRKIHCRMIIVSHFLQCKRIVERVTNTKDDSHYIFNVFLRETMISDRNIYYSELEKICRKCRTVNISIEFSRTS